MQKLKTHSRSSLFLMEMLISLLIIALACTACIKIYASAKLSRQQAREWNHIQELTSNTGEFLEGWDRDPGTFLRFFPGGQQKGNSFEYYYDTNWEICSPQKAAYNMKLTLLCEDRKKTASLCFSTISEKILYETEISFPDLTSEREDAQ